MITIHTTAQTQVKDDGSEEEIGTYSVYVDNGSMDSKLQDYAWESNFLIIREDPVQTNKNAIHSLKLLLTTLEKESCRSH